MNETLAALQRRKEHAVGNRISKVCDPRGSNAHGISPPSADGAPSSRASSDSTMPLTSRSSSPNGSPRVRTASVSSGPSLADSQLDGLAIASSSPPSVRTKDYSAYRLSREERRAIYEDVSLKSGWRQTQDMVDEVSNFVATQLQAAKAVGKTPLLLIGESHSSNTSLMVAMVAMKTLHDAGATGGVCMLEATPKAAATVGAKVANWCDERFREEAPSDAARVANETLLRRLTTGSVGEKHSWHGGLIAATATKLGMNVSGHAPPTPPGGNPAAPEREQAMVDAIHQQLQDGHGPVTAIVGSFHLPELKETLEGDAHVIPLAGIAEEHINTDHPNFDRMGRTLGEERANYVMSHPHVMRYDLNSTLVDYIEPLQYSAFAERLGIALSPKASTP